MEKNWSYKIIDGPHAGKTLWSGRYCAVAAFVLEIAATESTKATTQTAGVATSTIFFIFLFILLMCLNSTLTAKLHELTRCLMVQR